MADECDDDQVSGDVDAPRDWASFIAFPKIGQFRQCITEVKGKLLYHAGIKPGTPEAGAATLQYPTLEFWGSTKLHGTNAAIVVRPDRTMHVQSRNRVITVGNDNAGFAAFVQSAFPGPINLGSFSPPMAIYGEWCGGNIQKGVALSKLPRMFVIFAARTVVGDEDTWLSVPELTELATILKESSPMKDTLHCVLSAPIWNMTIDCDPAALEEVSARLEEITRAVEAECPFGKVLGVTGVGEGVVWRCITEGYRSPRYWFKVKGEEHAATKAKPGAPLAPAAAEKMASVAEFAERTVSETRLQQGWDYLREQNIPHTSKSIPDFVRWVVADIVKEEADTLVASNLKPKDVQSAISKLASKWYQRKVV